MSREHVVCIATPASGMVEVKAPSGSTLMYIYRGRRYLADEAVVRQHPELFRPVTPAAAETAA